MSKEECAFNGNETHEQWLQRRNGELLAQREQLFRDIERLEKLTSGLANLDIALLGIIAKYGVPMQEVHALFDRSVKQEKESNEAVAATWLATADTFKHATETLNRCGDACEELFEELKKP